jgi:High potential iron-sulfur protein
MNVTRRAMVKTLGLAAGVAAMTSRPARGADPPHLDVKDPTAVALGYVENAAQVDVKKYPDFVQGTNCENCLQLQGTAGNNYRPCSLFPGKLVSVSGWCKSWTPEI